MLTIILVTMIVDTDLILFPPLVEKCIFAETQAVLVSDYSLQRELTKKKARCILGEIELVEVIIRMQSL